MNTAFSPSKTEEVSLACGPSSMREISPSRVRASPRVLTTSCEKALALSSEVSALMLVWV